MGPLVRVTYSGLTQLVFRLDRVKSSSCDLPAKDSCGFQMPAALRVLVLVSAHPKLRSFVRLCAWFILSLGPKPPLAHYPAFIVCFATKFVQKVIPQVKKNSLVRLLRTFTMSQVPKNPIVISTGSSPGPGTCFHVGL